MAGHDPVIEAAKLGEPDRYLSALYAPEPARGRMIALAAFAGDLARIAAGVREPMLAEIRFQWWREALAAGQRGDATGHPIVDRLAPDVASGLLPPGLLLGMIDAAAKPNLGALFTDAQALKAQLSKSEGAAFALAARALGAAHSEALEAACERAGFAYGLARLLVRFSHPVPDLAAQCRQSLPVAAVAVARLDSALLPAFLPLTMTPAYLRQAEVGAAAATLPLRRWWHLWWANLRGQLT